MMPLADLAQLAIAGKDRVAGWRRIVVGESIILAGDDGDGHGALQVSAGRAASAVLPCPQVLPRPIARFAERRSGCGPQFRHRTPEGAQGSLISSSALCQALRITGGAWPMAIAGTPWSIAVTVGRITVAVGWIRIAVAISVIRICVVGPCEGASDKCAEREAAERRAPPTAPPAGISRGGRGNSRNRDGRRGENGQRFPHGVTSMSVETTTM